MEQVGSGSLHLIGKETVDLIDSTLQLIFLSYKMPFKRSIITGPKRPCQNQANKRTATIHKDRSITKIQKPQKHQNQKGYERANKCSPPPAIDRRRRRQLHPFRRSRWSWGKNLTVSPSSPPLRPPRSLLDRARPLIYPRSILPPVAVLDLLPTRKCANLKLLATLCA